MTITTNDPFSPRQLASLRSACQGAVSVPGEDRYDLQVATWNLAVRLRPALVVGARAADDVVAAVRWAARLGLAVGVNATGHGAVPNAEGALLINTRRPSRITIDPRHATATVGAGARMGDVTAAAARYGLAPVQGSSGSAGAAGFTLGGGLGVLSRRFGLAADHVLSVNVVTSDGRLRTVDADRHPELFWALRGGKGNFGVVTSYRTALVRLAAFYGGGIFFDGAHAADVLRAYRHWITGLTEQTSTSVALLHLPPDPAVPEPIRGRYVVQLRLAHAGDSGKGARLARGIRSAAPVLLDALGDLPTTSLEPRPPGPARANPRPRAREPARPAHAGYHRCRGPGSLRARQPADAGRDPAARRGHRPAAGRPERRSWPDGTLRPVRDRPGHPAVRRGRAPGRRLAARGRPAVAVSGQLPELPRPQLHPRRGAGRLAGPVPRPPARHQAGLGPGQHVPRRARAAPRAGGGEQRRPLSGR